MADLHWKATLSLVALAAVFLLKPSPGFADEENGLPTPPSVKPGTEGTIEDVRIMGMTFKQGRQVVSSSEANSVSVNVDIYAVQGLGSRPAQQHTTIQYRWKMGLTPSGDGQELTESIRVESTLENRFTGTTTTELYGSYTVNTDWERNTGSSYAQRGCEARSTWIRGLDGSSATFYKNIRYSNKRTADGNFFAGHQVSNVQTDYDVIDPFLVDPFSEKWTFARRTDWDIDFNIGKVNTHTVSINGAEQQNPFGLSMIEMAVSGGAMTPLISDPSVPALSTVPLEWPKQP